MTREQFRDRHRHELAGMMLEVATATDFAAKGRMLFGILERLDRKLDAMYADLTMAQMPAQNGTPKPPAYQGGLRR